MPKIDLTEPAVIYHSEEDGCWFAHGLHNDQIGTGDRLVAALADLMRGVRSLCEMAEKDETIAHLRPAPPEIVAMFKRSKPLPKELSEISHKMAFGEWPEYLHTDVELEGDDKWTFASEVKEAGCV